MVGLGLTRHQLFFLPCPSHKMLPISGACLCLTRDACLDVPVNSDRPVVGNSGGGTLSDVLKLFRDSSRLVADAWLCSWCVVSATCRDLSIMVLATVRLVAASIS